MPLIHKHAGFLLVISILGMACWSTEQDSVAEGPAIEHQPAASDTYPWIDVAARSAFDFPLVDDNLEHDTLLVQVTFDLLDGTYVMVASNREETFEGLRLYRYRLTSAGPPEMLAVSSPAYDSWTMLPTFFPVDTAHPADANWVLANFGEKESWGQKLMRLETAFHEIGFLDVALPEWVSEDDTLRLKRRNIAPHVRYELLGDTSIFTFACDSVYLYDDQEGHLNEVLHASRVRFTIDPGLSLSLWVDGRRRVVKRPA